MTFERVLTLSRFARSVPLSVLIRHLCAAVSRRASAAIQRQHDGGSSTYADDTVRLAGLFYRSPPLDSLRLEAEWLRPVTDHYLRHRFDLLGSGWIEVRHGIACRGMDGHAYPAGPAVAVDPDGQWLEGRVPDATSPESRKIWRLIDHQYRPIDWQLDFKSGYRWREDIWYLDVPYGHLPGVDIKLPWELARMQHLPQLALARALASKGFPRFADAACYDREFRNQVLDFIATNPPRFGVNWRCAMDVAIRISNWLVAYDLFRDAGAAFDTDFEATLARSTLDHARHIAANLEETGGFRGNHYLADICGLLYAAAWLEETPEVRGWRDFALAALLRETDRQFLEDGGNFEASTSYHRLSAEMVFHSSAVGAVLSAREHRPSFPAAHWRRLAAMADFTRAILKPDGMVPQVGDNDSGRFLKLSAAYRSEVPDVLGERYPTLRGYPVSGNDPYWMETHLDHRPFVALADNLLGRSQKGETAEAAIARDMRRAGKIPAPSSLVPPAFVPRNPPAAANLLQAIRIVVPGGNLRVGLSATALSAFGLYVMQSSRVYLAIRCGSIGQRGRGGHAHNDQLSLELMIDGESWIADPGSYIYTPDPAARNRYRSAAAHFSPRLGSGEPARLDVGLFWLPDDPKAVCHHFDVDEFVGSHSGFGTDVIRRVRLSDESIDIEDRVKAPTLAPPSYLLCQSRAEVQAQLEPDLPYSPGYGILRTR
jgi:hypothetical protein